MHTTKTFTLEQLITYASQPHNADRKFRLRDRNAWKDGQRTGIEYYLDEAHDGYFSSFEIVIPAEVAERLFPLFPKNFVAPKTYGTDRAQTLVRLVKALGVSDIGERVKKAQLAEEAAARKATRNRHRRNIAAAAETLRKALLAAAEDTPGFVFIAVDEGETTMADELARVTNLTERMTREIEA